MTDNKNKFKKILKRFSIVVLSLILLIVLLFTLGIVITNKPQMQQISYEPVSPDYWPTQDLLKVCLLKKRGENHENQTLSI